MKPPGPLKSDSSLGEPRKSFSGLSDGGWSSGEEHEEEALAPDSTDSTDPTDSIVEEEVEVINEGDWSIYVIPPPRECQEPLALILTLILTLTLIMFRGGLYCDCSRRYDSSRVRARLQAMCDGGPHRCNLGYF